MFMNSNSLPIALMKSLVASVPALRRSSDDEPDAMLARALMYLVVFSTLGLLVSNCVIRSSLFFTLWLLSFS